MTFRPHDGVVELAGVPTYRLWRDGLTASGKPTDPIDFATAYIVEFEAAGHDVAWAKNRARKLAKDLAHSRRISNDKLRELADTVGASKNDVTLRLAALAMMEEAALAQQVVLVPPAENPLSDSAVIAASNPTVYHAVTAFAQTAAFLRYVRTSYPRARRSFRRSTAAFEAPAVTVPARVARAPATASHARLPVRERTLRELETGGARAARAVVNAPLAFYNALLVELDGASEAYVAVQYAAAGIAFDRARIVLSGLSSEFRP